MTNKEYIAQRRELDRQLAALDQLHMKDRQFQDGEEVEIDSGYFKRHGVICGCFIDTFDGSIQYKYHPLRKSGLPSKNTCHTYRGCKISRV